MTYEELQSRLADVGLGHKVLLGVGAMSKNCVDALIEMNNILKLPIQLVASRRQIECNAVGTGYVGWSTEEFVKHVRKTDTSGNILLTRHGGPWQGRDESELSISDAMHKASVSLEWDILCGFDVLHIDAAFRDRPIADIMQDVETLLQSCENVPGAEDVTYEVGTTCNGAEDFEAFVKFCKNLSPKIRFVSAQTGTLVKDGRNIGTYDPAKARELVAICNRHGLLFKEHNLDYATEKVLKDHRPAGIHSANVCPEFGVIETTKLLELLKTHKLKKERKRFIQVAHESKQWEKWVVGDLGEEEKARLAGHYVFDHPEVREICATLNEKMYLNEVLKADIYSAFIKYLKEFRWLV